MARDFWDKRLVEKNLDASSFSSDVHSSPHNSTAVVETSLTTSAMSRHTMSVQAAGAGSHSPRVGGGGRVAVFRAALVSTRTVLEILPSYLRCCPPNIS